MGIDVYVGSYYIAITPAGLLLFIAIVVTVALACGAAFGGLRK